jgi:hypothetical protein
VLAPLRASNEHILIVRVPRARDQHGCCSGTSKLARSLSGMGADELLLRASNEGSPRPRVARAKKIIRFHPLLYGLPPFASPHFFFKGGLVDPLVRASNEALLIPHRLQRGQTTVLHCAHRATTALSWGLCEQEGWLAAPSHPSERARSASRRTARLPILPLFP